jgi:hypothetical protein
LHDGALFQLRMQIAQSDTTQMKLIAQTKYMQWALSPVKVAKSPYDLFGTVPSPREVSASGGWPANRERIAWNQWANRTAGTPG